MFESKFFELSFEDRELNFSSDETAAKKLYHYREVYDGTSLRTSTMGHH